MYRRLLAYSLWLSGLLFPVRWFRRKQLTILTVHGVIDRDELSWQPLRSFIEVRRFERYITALSQHHTFLSLEDTVQMLDGEIPWVDNAISLTFDDGYQNNIQYALPVLKRLGIPVTIFPVAGNLESPRPFWFDRLDYAMQMNLAEHDQVEFGGVVCEVDMSTPASSRRSVVSCVRKILEIETDDFSLREKIDGWIERIEAKRGKRLDDIFVDDPCSRLASLAAFQQLVSENSAVEIGSHTMNHTRLVEISEAQISEELAGSKRYLAEKLGRCRYVCYPNGLADDTTGRLAADAGYEAGVTGVEGVNELGANPLMLKRINMPMKCTIPEILCLAVGIGISDGS